MYKDTVKYYSESELHYKLFDINTLKCILAAQLCPTLCNPMDCSPTGSSIHEILQARILEWVAISPLQRNFLTQGSFKVL